MSKELQELLELARSLIRDAACGYSTADLAADPEAVCAQITKTLGDTYNFETGDTL